MNPESYSNKWDYSRKVEHASSSADVMCEGMQKTLASIRALDETWDCPQEEKV